MVGHEYIIVENNMIGIKDSLKVLIKKSRLWSFSNIFLLLFPREAIWYNAFFIFVFNP